MNSHLTVQELVLQCHSKGRDGIKLHSINGEIHSWCQKQHVNIQETELFTIEGFIMDT